jgi:hypothetical protein
MTKVDLNIALKSPFAADIVLVPLGERGFEGDVEINFGHGLLPLNYAA